MNFDMTARLRDRVADDAPYLGVSANGARLRRVRRWDARIRAVVWSFFRHVGSRSETALCRNMRSACIMVGVMI